MSERDPEMLEQELEALSTIVNALAPLSKQQRERVLRHIAEDLGIIDRQEEGR